MEQRRKDRIRKEERNRGNKEFDRVGERKDKGNGR